MAKSKLAGMAQTVLGPIPADELGVTITHEHLLIDFTCVFEEPADPAEKELAYQPISLENLGWIRRYYTSNLDNLKYTDEEVAVAEAKLYKQAGGNTIVDVSNWGLGRNPEALARIAQSTGLNIIMGTGYYVWQSLPSDMDSQREEDIAQAIVRDITEGVGNTGIRSGIIGEIGCSWPWTEGERKSVRAAVMAQQMTGAPLMIHPGRHPQAPQEIVETLKGLGADLSHTVIAHIDRTIFDFDSLARLADSGCYLEYDMFGEETSYYPFSPSVDMPNDALRIDYIRQLIEAGYLSQIVVSQDICTKIHLVRYGGDGFAHILKHIVPTMRRKGLTEEQIRALLVDNPKRLLQFV
ncbi:MAG TPA: phosphotriesterase-related protein [Dehalococcoidia bacterium]|nr:phosphotriesterase-related protein [Dehalococcoidia bacterium]